MAAQGGTEGVAAAAVAAGEALASASAALAAPSVQEDVSPALLAEFLKDSRKKEKLLWGQLQVVDALQGFLEHMDMTVNTEEEIRAEASAVQKLWKDLKAEHQKQVEAIEAALPQALEQLEASQRKQALLGSALRQAQAKRQALEERKNMAQARQKREQEKRRQRLVAGAQGQSERLENAKKNRERALTLQYEEEENAHRLGAFLGLLEMLHGAGGMEEMETSLEHLQQALCSNTSPPPQRHAQ
ncbi:outer kinetochore KNL1 complex subunit ZWINT isoform X3 [Phascolarctos cinereus]|uniref:ZW10 interactor isoform X2 n=1 Tax=Phascolarctos cinereus TaxID=38626 RepID=A0A6P5JD58_PHACI|nr:ZW10 interactor isoform X2 [Phascolarctos cinereus]